MASKTLPTKIQKIAAFTEQQLTWQVNYVHGGVSILGRPLTEAELAAEKKTLCDRTVVHHDAITVKIMAEQGCSDREIKTLYGDSLKTWSFVSAPRHRLPSGAACGNIHISSGAAS